MAQRATDGLIDQPSSDSAGAYALLAVLQAESNDAPAAFATLERRRVHALRLELARNERDIARGMTQAERDRERQSAADIATIRAQLDHERALPKPDAARLERLSSASPPPWDNDPHNARKSSHAFPSSRRGVASSPRSR